MKNIKLYLFAFAALCSNSVFSQYYYYNDKYYDKDWVFEFGGGAGGMNSITDIGGPKGKGGLYLNDLNGKYTQMSTTAYFGGMYQDFVGVRLEFTLGSVRGSDQVLEGATASNTMLRYDRNLNFFSTITEAAMVGEFHPLRLFEKEPSTLSPYIMAGLGWFKFKPQGNINGRVIDLQPLRTEGQGFAEYKDREMYRLSQANVPFGFGLKYEISSMFNVRVEAMHRFLFTDYLDDVSTNYIDRALFDKYLSPIQAAQANALYLGKRNGEPMPGVTRGNSSSMDSYMTFTIKGGITLGRERRR